MTEHAPHGFDAHPLEQEPAPESSEPATEPTRTGVASVDAVLDDLSALDELPLEEHLAAFEKAHGSLRAALDADASAGDLA